MERAAHRIAIEMELKMKDLVQKLKDFRIAEEQALEQLATAESVLKQSEPYQVALQCQAYLEAIREELKETDEAIRAQAIVNYHQTGDKNPVDGVSVVINKVFSYPVNRAVEWAINNSLDMLKLDTKKFEKHARAVNDTLPIEFVEVKEEPSVRIASRL